MLTREIKSEGKSSSYSDYSFKVILIGEKGSGKTCLAHRITEGLYSDQYKPTFHCYYSDIFYTLNEEGTNKSVRISLWDTSGEEKYQSITRTYFAAAQGALVLYDTTSIESFKKVTSWVNLINETADQNVVLFLVGAKSDLVAERVVTFDMIEDYIIQQHIDPKNQAIVSSKTGSGVEDLFKNLTRLLIEQKKRESVHFPMKDVQKLNSKNPKGPKSDECKC